MFRLDWHGISDIGLVRPNNEDAWAYLPSANLFALADGMGGHPAGEVAAKIAIQTLCASMAKQLPFAREFSIEQAAYQLKEAMHAANQAVLSSAEQEPAFSGMGTTLCSCMFYNNHLIYAHVGDSRIYRLRSSLEQLTQDHLSSTYKITRAIGTSADVIPELGIFPVHPGDIYLLCSDGLTDPLDQEEILAALTDAPTLRQGAETLIAKAKEKQGRDNITLILAQVLDD